MKQSAAAQAKEQFKLLMHERPFDIEIMREIMYTFFVRDDIIRAWERFFNKVETGEVQILREDKMNFKSDARQQFAEKLTFQVDPVSRVSMMGSKEDRNDTSWHVIRPDALVANFRDNGTYGVIYGVPRSGKTSLATMLMRIIRDEWGITPITNIKLNDGKGICYVTKVSELIRAMVEEDEWIIVLDETGTYIDRKKPMQRTNIDFENLARFMGKLRGRMIMATHDYERDVPPKLQNFITEKYWKRSKKRVRVDLTKDGGHIKMHQTIGNVPDAVDSNGKPIYMTEDISGLKFDVDISELLDDIPETRGHRQEEYIIEWLNKKEEEANRPSPTDIRDMVKEMVDDKNISVSDACERVADKVGLQVGTVRNYYYKKGG